MAGGRHLAGFPTAHVCCALLSRRLAAERRPTCVDASAAAVAIENVLTRSGRPRLISPSTPQTTTTDTVSMAPPSRRRRGRQPSLRVPARLDQKRLIRHWPPQEELAGAAGKDGDAHTHGRPASRGAHAQADACMHGRPASRRAHMQHHEYTKNKN